MYGKVYRYFSKSMKGVFMSLFTHIKLYTSNGTAGL